ncbi:hypothetical protein Tpet_1735 [Thermotoga petrophila RKU-1]|uniref:Uncharacterized protein n=1 Tax=Thermotoga petrophila (strain ATCC BAA-488 / DSM 13995 / JCM 10881 / RKU-1) TaxID=390874 RepID=A5ING5_THEP1|nr:hypothetical protein [Thermotoga petrophila]ABQ47738.1 hypothetical protein Tpet_1735 [Thermotoga petrophila RKU-1]
MNNVDFNSFFEGILYDYYLLEESLTYLRDEKQIQKELDQIYKELSLLRFPISVKDTLAAIFIGIVAGLFEVLISESGLAPDHKHEVTRVPIDYAIPKPQGFKGSVSDLHRQIGPGHDLLRFKEAIEMMKGEKIDFPLWDSTISEVMNGKLRPIGLSIEKAEELNGFNIPEQPILEWLKHMYVDLFTRRSLPVPGTTLIADGNPRAAEIVLNMYKNGFNLKNLLAGGIGILAINVGIKIYWSLKLFKDNKDRQLPFVEAFKETEKQLKEIQKTEKFTFMEMISYVTLVIISGLKSAILKELFSFNFGACIMFIKALLSYIKKIQEKRKNLLETKNLKLLELSNINNAWTRTTEKQILYVINLMNEYQRVISDDKSNCKIELDNEISNERMIKALREIKLYLENIRRRYSENE